MGILYITGALLYAMRIPERFFPGKLDIWVRIFSQFQVLYPKGRAFISYAKSKRNRCVVRLILKLLKYFY